MPVLGNSSESEPSGRGECHSRDLQRILHAIADQIATEDEHRTAKLSGLKDRLDLLGASKTEDGETLLRHFAAHRDGLDEASPLDPAPFTSTLSTPAISEHPSELSSGRAEAVKQVGGDDQTWALDDESRVQPVPESSVAGGQLSNDELGMVFVEIADKLDAVMSAMPSEAVMNALDLRLHAIESRMAEVEAAGRSGTVNDQQVSEIKNHIIEAQRELERLDRVESELRLLADRMSEDKLSGLMGVKGLGEEECELISRQVVSFLENSTLRNAPTEGAAEESQETLQRFMVEQREGDERTAMMLDTMQQALIRLLDRIDELEFDRSHNAGFSTFESGLGGKGHDAVRNTDSLPVSTSATDLATVNSDHLDVLTSDNAESDDSSSSKQCESTSSENDTNCVEQPEREKSTSRSVSQSECQDESNPGSDDQTSRHQSERIALIASARRAAQLAANKPAAGEDPATQADAEMAVRKGVAPSASQAIAGASKPSEKRKSSFFKLPFTSTAVILIGLGIGYKSFEALSWMPELEMNQTIGHAVNLSGDPGSLVSDPDVVSLDAVDSDGEMQSASDKGAISTHSAARDVQQPEMQDERPQSATHPLSFVQEVSGGSAVDNRPQGIPVALNSGSDSVGPTVTGGANSPAATKLALPPSRIGPLSLRLAAANGDPSAEFEVAARFAEGKGIDHDLKEAAAWYMRSAAKGFAAAQYRIATLYERGVGVARDLERAKVWYQRAAEQGHVKAMHNLGVLLAGMNEGRGDYTAAARWFTEAAEYGLKDSQFNLAILFDSGLGLPRDEKLAYKWFAIAAKGGDEDALRRMQRVQAKITSSDLASIKGEIERWGPKAKDHLVNDPRAAGELWKRRSVAAEPN